MSIHKNARLTPHDRERLARSVVERGLTPEAAACDAGVRPRTARKWSAGFKTGGLRARGAKPSRPHKLRAPTPPAIVAQIKTLRRKRLSGACIAKAAGVSPAAVSRIW